MGRLLAIDYGSKRCGLAVSDSLKLIAGGLATVSTSDLLRFLADYAAKESIDIIIIGEPRQMNGTESQTMPMIRSLADKLKRLFPSIKIVFYDERFTSVLAHKAMIDGGMKKKKRRQKAVVDEISATIILEDYMNSAKKSFC